MKKLRILAGNRCPERGCVVLDLPQFVKAWITGIFRALRLLFDTAVLLSVPIATACLLMLTPSSAHAQGGAPLWTNTTPGDAIATDNNGNVFVTGGGSVIVKYSATGVPLWTNFSNTSYLAVDSAGNVFVAGYSWNGSNSDFLIIKYSNSGMPLWTNCYNGLDNRNDGPRAISVDRNGNVFVTGSSGDVNPPPPYYYYYDYLTVAYSSSGALLWANTYDGSSGGDDGARAIAVDSNNGNVFVTGSSREGVGGGDFSDLDYVTIAYSSTGDLLWINRYNGPGNNYDVPSALAVDHAGNVFVTGQTVGSDFQSYYGTIAYSNSGDPLGQWTNRYSGFATGIACDSNGNVFVTGTSGGYATIKYSNAGAQLWARRYSGSSGQIVYANAVAVDSSGNVFVTGEFEVPGATALTTLTPRKSRPRRLTPRDTTEARSTP